MNQLPITVWIAAIGLFVSPVYSQHETLTFLPYETPIDLRVGATESNHKIWILEESSDQILNTNLSIDIVTPGMYDSWDDDLGGFIPAGTRVNSYLIHTDPAGSPIDGEPYFGFWNFDEPILGIIASKEGLDVTDSLLGSSFVVYPTGQDFRGLELAANEFLWTKFTSNGVGFRFTTFGHVDEFRVITLSSIPEPGPGLLLFASTFGFIYPRRRNNPNVSHR